MLSLSYIPLAALQLLSGKNSPVSLLDGSTKPRHVQGHNVFVCNMNVGILNQVF